MENRFHKSVIIGLLLFVVVVNLFTSSPLSAGHRRLWDLDTLLSRHDSTSRDSLLVDSLAVRDSLDTLPVYVPLDSLAKLDSARVADSLWYAGLSKKERRKVDAERKEKELEAKMAIKIAKADSLDSLKAAKKARKDSIISATPRILETYIIPDSLQYKRMITWTRDRMFNDISVREIDTSYNAAFFDMPYFKKDVNATHLGVSGSPAQTFNFFKRSVTQNAFFYSNYEDYSYSAESLPQFNAKSPYTEFDYTGTLLAGREKEESNVRVLTSTNITPAVNMTLSYHQYGTKGQLLHEGIKNRTAFVALNHVGKRYVAHGGYIFNSVKASENGGMIDPMWIRDTTVQDPHEIPVRLDDASSVTKKHVVYLDQSYRLPFATVREAFHRKKEARAAAKAAALAATAMDSLALASEDSLAALAAVDSLAVSEDLASNAETAPATGGASNVPGPPPGISSLQAVDLDHDHDHEGEGHEDAPQEDYRGTAFYVGHNSELSIFRRVYEDKVSATTKYNPYEHFYMNPSTSHDSLRVLRLDNKVYVRLQPWKDDFAISKLDVGVGDRYVNYFVQDPQMMYFSKKRNVAQNTFYIYAGARGQVKKYFEWDAQAQYNLIGFGQSDFFVRGNMKFSFYPFRQRSEPISLLISAGTDLRSPDFYENHFFSNHYRWDNDFARVSTTKFGGAIEIPKWKLNARVDYALLANNLYFDTKGIIRQNGTPMSVLTASLEKNFVLWKFHLDNRLLAQFSSNQDVVPLPVFAMNLRWYFEFTVVRGALDMQIGANVTYNTKWFAPAYNPVTATFISQKEHLYGNDPLIDVFLNLQWKRACIFIKVINVGNGWPLTHPDFFTASGYIAPMRTVKFGIHWPFYVWPSKGGATHSHDHSHGSSRPSASKDGAQAAASARGLRQNNSR